MSKKTINILGAGLCSSLGGYRDACAADRAGLVRFSGDTSFAFSEAGDDEPSPLTVAPAACNFHLFQGITRTVKMLQTAYHDFKENCRHEIPTDNLVILAAIPDPKDRAQEFNAQEDSSRELRLQTYLDDITSKLFPLINPQLSDIPVQCVFGDRVAFARIFDKAVRILSNGEAKHCLLMVHDCLLEGTYLEEQLNAEQLKTDDNPVGYIPGEGSAFILVSAEEGRGMPLEVSFAIDNSTIDSDEDRQALWQADKLTKVVKALVDTQNTSKIFPQFVTDINGEESRSQEFGILQVKLLGAFPNTHFLDAKIPALSFAETGAMAGALAFLTTIASLQRRYARHNEFLILLSEYSGKRAAIYIKDHR